MATFSAKRTRGDTIHITVSITQTVNGVTSPLPLTGYTVWFTAKLQYSDPDNLAVFQKKSGLTNTDGSNQIDFTDINGGKVQVNIMPQDTANLIDDSTTLVCDVQVKDPTGEVFTPATGKLTITGDVTRTTWSPVEWMSI